ncbi:phosphoadenosine phosphosulfate reductase family protein [Halorubrum sp. DTA98]|uniref:phosphoadenosine phosphosulfate reductase family protein n=1 Tax=Halorubrum sp. DTA98 TaxID=3402163 RepID=UPI003AAB7792
MDDQFPDYVGVDYDAGFDESVDSYPTLESKVRRATDVTRTALDRYRNPALLWTGGKDSTLALSIAVRIADEDGVDPPTAVFLDHLQQFTEIRTFVECWADEWGLDLVVARNDSVASVVRDRGLKPGESVPIDDLTDRNKWHVRRILGFEEETFPFLLGTTVADHLLTELPINDVLDEHDIDGLITGTRWDDGGIRGDDVTRDNGTTPDEERTQGEERTSDEANGHGDERFFSPRHDSDRFPPHDRIHPLLPFTEQDVWGSFFTHVFPDVVDGYPVGHVPDSPEDLPDGIEPASVPVPSLYFDGFRSVGNEVPTSRPGDTPAWTQASHETTQDSQGTARRVGRGREDAELTEQLDQQGSL